MTKLNQSWQHKDWGNVKETVESKSMKSWFDIQKEMTKLLNELSFFFFFFFFLGGGGGGGGVVHDQ